eukprot:2477305-Prorocentrum_lima.AAC.1
MPKHGSTAPLTVCLGHELLAIHDYGLARQVLFPPSIETSAAKDNVVTLASKASAEMQPRL